MPGKPQRKLLSSVDCARMLGWTTERAHDWMIREKLAIKVGRRYFTTPTKLRDAFPELYDELLLAGLDE